LKATISEAHQISTAAQIRPMNSVFSVSVMAGRLKYAAKRFMQGNRSSPSMVVARLILSRQGV
jgi:thiazole synthase ThiGH ThiG subunit